MPAKKTIGRGYLLGHEERYKPGEYFFAGYTKCCATKHYMDHYESQEFINNAKPRMWKPPLIERIWKMLPLPKLSFETQEGRERRIQDLVRQVHNR